MKAAVTQTLLVLAMALPAGADPVLIYSMRLGGSRSDLGEAVAARGGNTFVAGRTYSPDYPVLPPSPGKPHDESLPDIFVTALGPDGVPFYSTFLSTIENNASIRGLGIGAGPDGSAYVAVWSYEGVAGATNITRLDPAGDVVWDRKILDLVYANGMTVDSQGNLYLTGLDQREDRNQAFVWKLDPDGEISYQAGIDGNGSDGGFGVAVDAAGRAYVTGYTDSTNLPKAIQAPPAGGYNAFVTALDPAGAVLWSTYLGGAGDDFGKEIEVAADGTLVVAGTTQSSNFPTLNAAQTGLRGSQDVFLARFRYWGSRISSTYLGGSGSDSVRDLALEPASLLLVVDGASADSPLRELADPSCGGNLLGKLNATASRVLDATCLAALDAVAADASGISVTGSAEGDAFAAKLRLNHPPDCSAATADPGILWIPDEKFVSVAIRGVTDPDGERVTLALTSIFQDEGLTSPSQPDASGIGGSTARLRASRLSSGNGRVYHLRFTATDTQGGACAGLVKVCVPTASSGICGDGGARVDSTRPIF